MFFLCYIDYALANVIAQYDQAGRSYLNDAIEYDGVDNNSGRRVRRPESTLQQAAEYVCSGETFQKVSSMLSIPISTIRYEGCFTLLPELMSLSTFNSF